MSFLEFFSSPLRFPYPTSASFLSQAIFGAGMGLVGVAAGVHFTGTPLPLPWLLVPAGVAFAAAWAVGPGMREELRVSSEPRTVMRRVHTLGWPQEEALIDPEDLRTVALAKYYVPGDDEAEASPGGLLVVVDWRARWLVLAEGDDHATLRARQDRVAKALNLPAIEIPCPEGWVPSWGTIQPAPPPPPAREQTFEPDE